MIRDDILARNVRVASISFSGSCRPRKAKETVKQNLEIMSKLLEEAYYDEADLVCFPETSPTAGLPIEKAIALAEPVPGEIFDLFSRKAQEYHLSIVLPMLEVVDEHVYNSAVLISRDGEYLGSYHKVHPTIGEIEAGVTPGIKPKVLRSEFGPLGFAICFDLNFRDIAEAISAANAKLVIFPSAYPGGLQLSIWAFDYGVYVVSSVRGEKSSIVDPLGRILARSSVYNPIICKTLNLDYEIFHIDYNYERLLEIKRKYGSKAEIDMSRPEAIFMLTSHLKEKTVTDLASEFNLETREQYFLRSERIRAESLKRMNFKK